MISPAVPPLPSNQHREDHVVSEAIEGNTGSHQPNSPSEPGTEMNGHHGVDSDLSAEGPSLMTYPSSEASAQPAQEGNRYGISSRRPLNAAATAVRAARSSALNNQVPAAVPHKRLGSNNTAACKRKHGKAQR